MLGKLTLKQRKFWQHYQNSHNKARAAQYAGCQCNSVQSYSTQGNAILKSLELSMPEMLNAMGLTDELLAEKTFDGLGAKHVVVATFQGKIGGEKSYTDYSTRAKYVELLGRMKGVFVDKHEITGKDGGEISLVVNKAPRKGSKTLEFD